MSRFSKQLEPHTMTAAVAKTHITALRKEWNEDEIEITHIYFDIRKPKSHIFIRFTYRGEKYKYESSPSVTWDLH